MKTFISVVAVLALSVALAVPAFGSSPSVEAYSDEGGQVLSQVQGGDDGTPPTAKPATADPASTLPFTGLDVSLLAAAGGLLVAAGIGMRRLTRAPHSA